MQKRAFLHGSFFTTGEPRPRGAERGAEGHGVVCAGGAESYLTMTDDTIRMPEASLIASISAERRMNTSLRATDELR